MFGELAVVAGNQPKRKALTAPAPASLDPEEKEEEEEGMAEIQQWCVVEPAEDCDVRLAVREHGIGLRCNRRDLRRLQSGLLDVFLGTGQSTFWMAKGWFKDSLVFEYVWGQLLVSDSGPATEDVNLALDSMHALDLLHLYHMPLYTRLKAVLVAQAPDLPSDKVLAAAERFRMPELLPIAARTIAREWSRAN